MSFTIYDNVLDLPILDVTPGDEAFVQENSTFYLYEDLSLSTTYSYEFGGVSSYLSIPDVLDVFTSSTDPITIDFWSFSNELLENPVFTIETPNINYTFSDELEHTLDIGGSPKSFYFSPYDSSVTSEYLGGNDRFRITDIQSDLTGQNEPYNIEYWTRASNSSFTIFSSYKTDKDESILEINSNGIVSNGINLTGDISYETDSWQHNRILYDGFDYSFYQNGEPKVLNYPPASVFDSDDEIGFQDVDVFNDVGFECKVTFPSSPSEGVLFEIGGSDNRVRVELINGGNTLFFTAGEVAMNLSVSVTDFPKDGLSHIVTWDIQIEPRRIRLWIDGDLKGTSSSSSPMNSNLWATTDKIGPLNNATGFQSVYWRTLQLLDGGKRYYAATNSGIDTYSAKGGTFNKSGDKIYYLEMQMENMRTRHFLRFLILDPNTRFRWRMSYYSPRDELLYKTLYWYNIRAGYTISIFISEINSRVYFFRNGSLYLGSLSFGRIDRTTGLQYGIESYYNNPSFHFAHSREYWKYDPLTFNSSVIDVGPEGSYGSDLVEGVSSNPWPGELLSQLRMYPQCISELGEGSFNIGNQYKPFSNTNRNGYRGYIKDFHLSTESSGDFGIDSSLIDSGVDSGSLSIPSQSIIESSKSKLLIKSQVLGGKLLSYETSGTLNVLGVEYNVDSQENPRGWNHRRISFDGDRIKFFDNGILKFTDSIDLSPYTFSDAALNIGRGTYIDYDNATYNNYFMKGNISDFRIVPYSFGDSNFELPGVHSDDSSVLLTANKINVEDNNVITNVNGVSSTEISPFSATTRRWYKYGNLSKKMINVTSENDHLLYEFPDSYSNNNNSSISAVIELRDYDAAGNKLTWNPELIQSPDPVLSLKRIGNKFLVEPILQEDSHLSRGNFINFTGTRDDSGIPSVITSDIDPVVGDLHIDFSYLDVGIEVADKSNIYLTPYYELYEKDSAADSDFRNVSPLPTQTWIVPMEIYDSIGSLP